MPIKLNFFALAEQDISFTVYRQEYQNQQKQPGYYRSKLPISDGNEYSDYWVSFQQKDSFESYRCSSNDNPYLTIDLIWETFLAKLRESLDVSDYMINQKFSRSVSLIINKHKEGNEVINIEPYYFKEEKKFGFLVDFRFKSNHDITFTKKIQQLSLSLDKNFYSNKNYYSDKYDKLKVFVNQYRSELFPLSIENRNYNLEPYLLSLPSSSLHIKTYIFKDGKESYSQFNGLKDNGPILSVKKSPLLIFIFQEHKKDLANELYNALIGKSFPYSFAGMEKMFGMTLSKDNLSKFIIQSFTKSELEKIACELDNLVNQYSNRTILGLFIESGKDKFTVSEFSPYYFLKLIFLKKQVPLQAVTIERIQGRDGLKWSASGIGLQIFAKLGGIPWKVKPSNDNCIIFGIGSAHKKDEDGNIKKYFAYSVCLDSSGIYKKIDILGSSEDEQDYIKQLESNIKKVISEQIDNNQSIDKCVIHLPFKIKRVEIQGIKNSVSAISVEHEKIDFRFIKINTDNKFFGYAENNSKVPYESSYIKLSKNEYLVWFEGLQYGKENVLKKVGNPVHIQFMDDSDLDESAKKKYLQDIINLSGANWRGFNAKLSPISIYYPDIIARYLSEFSKYDEMGNINISNITIPWFL